MVPAHADLVADEFIAELERVEPVATDGAVAQADHRAPKYVFKLVLQRLERIQRTGMLDPLADVEDGGGEFAGLFGRNPGDLGVDAGKDRSDHAERGGAEIEQVTVAIHERLGV